MTPSESARWPRDGGEMGARVRAHDWRATPLGPLDAWPADLRIAVGVVLSSAEAMAVYWGREYILIYNDLWRRLMGTKHPALGRPMAEVFPEVWDTIGPMLDGVMESGRPVWREGQLLPVTSTDGVQDAWFTYSFNPIFDAEGRSVGVLGMATEVTQRRRVEQALRASARRSRFRARLADALRTLDQVDAVKERAAELLGEHLQVDRCVFGDVSEDGNRATVHRGYTHRGVASIAGTYEVADFDPFAPEALRTGVTVAVNDVDREAPHGEAQEAYRRLGIRAMVTAPLMARRGLAAFFSVHSSEPRQWSADEVALVEETAERTWATVERIRTEGALRDSERRYRRLFESMEEGFCALEPVYGATGEVEDFRYLVVNRALARATGGAEVEGHTVMEVSGEMPAQALATLRQVLESGNPLRADLALPNGRHVELYAYRVEGDPTPSIAVIFTDVTARLRAEQVRRESAERLQRMADSMPQLVWTANAAGDVQYYSARGADYEGLDPEPSPETPSWQPVLHPDDLHATRLAWRAAVTSGENYEIEHRVRMRDGSYRWHLTRAEQVTFSGGQVEWYGTSTDIHELKMADELKDRFLAIASHELRNPVGVIHGMAQQMHRALERGQLSEGRLDAYVDGLLRSSTYLARLTNDLMDVSRLQRGLLTLHQEPAIVADLVDGVAAADGWPDRVHREFEDDLPAVFVDPPRIQQVISNLVDNALKYSDRADPVVLHASRGRLEASTEGADNLDDGVRIQVIDRGIGLPADALEEIFSPFGRAQNVGAISGLGMGLYVAREIVERHGGRLWAASEGEGHGTTMTLWLPVAPGEA